MSGMPKFTVHSFSLSVPYFKTFLNLAGGSKTRFTNVLSALQAFFMVQDPVGTSLLL
jgi:hypothetical protein